MPGSPKDKLSFKLLGFVSGEAEGLPAIAALVGLVVFAVGMWWLVR